MEAHDAAVRRIAAQVKTFHEAQKPFRIYHGSTNSTRTSHRRADNTIDTSRLNRVLSVDKTGMTALVEPNVPMDALVDATLAHGLVPPVVMEFPGITAGGGFSGTSGESSSFRYGAFDSTFDWIEIVLADGATARASRTDKADLFWGAASAFGTLGVVTLLAVRLRPAKRYVALRYARRTRGSTFARARCAGCCRSRRARTPSWSTTSRWWTTCSAGTGAASGWASTPLPTSACRSTGSRGGCWTASCARASCTARCTGRASRTRTWCRTSGCRLRGRPSARAARRLRRPGRAGPGQLWGVGAAAALPPARAGRRGEPRAREEGRRARGQEVALRARLLHRGRVLGALRPARVRRAAGQVRRIASAQRLRQGARRRRRRGGREAEEPAGQGARRAGTCLAVEGAEGVLGRCQGRRLPAEEDIEEEAGHGGDGERVGLC
ncbi:FAD binding domain protein, partial [Metarhizium brunneum ARSEF 3297]